MRTTQRTNLGGDAVADATLTFASITNNTSVPYLQGIASLVDFIRQNVQSVQTNRDDFLRISEKATEFMKVLINFERSGKAIANKMNSDLQLKVAISELQKTLNDVATVVRYHADLSLPHRIVRQEDDRNLVIDCERAIKAALEVFQTQLAVFQDAQLGRIGRNLRQLGAGGSPLDNDDDTWLDQDTSGLRTASPESSLGPHAHLPHKPPFSVGRAAELQNLVTAIQHSAHSVFSSSSASSSRFPPSSSRSHTTLSRSHAILGPPSIGKSWLGVRLLLHPSISNIFGAERYFVQCEDIATAEDLREEIGMTVLLARGETSFGDDVDFVDLFGGEGEPHGGGRSILVLDNLDSAWEGSEERADVEALLSQLASIPSLTLIITLRGMEAPRGVDWARSIPPLGPLDQHEARELFLQVSGLDSSPASPSLLPPPSPASSASNPRDELLALTGNLPLPIHIFATLAQSEPIPSLLKRWAREGTGMLSLNADIKDNFDAVIRRSVEGARMRSGQPWTGLLLNVVALLPDGVRREDLARIVPLGDGADMREVERAAEVLHATGLAYSLPAQDGSEREERQVCLLPPIRAFVRRYYPPSTAAIRCLERYACEMLESAPQTSTLSATAQTVSPPPTLLPEITNLDAILHHTLSLSSSLSPATLRTVKALLTLGSHTRHLSLSPSRTPFFKDSLSTAARLAGELGGEGLRAACLGMAQFWRGGERAS